MDQKAMIKKNITPYISTPVPAGFPSPALDYMEKAIDLNDVYIKHPSSTFLVDCTGDSMINAFIPPTRARLIIDRSLTPKNGDIVLASVNGEFTVKFLRKNDVKISLVAANRKYPDIIFKEGETMEIVGVVTAIITDPKDVRACML